MLDKTEKIPAPVPDRKKDWWLQEQETHCSTFNFGRDVCFKYCTELFSGPYERSLDFLFPYLDCSRIPKNGISKCKLSFRISCPIVVFRWNSAGMEQCNLVCRVWTNELSFLNDGLDRMDAGLIPCTWEDLPLDWSTWNVCQTKQCFSDFLYRKIQVTVDLRSAPFSK